MKCNIVGKAVRKGRCGNYTILELGTRTMLDMK
jgi:hypothetical protein